MMRNGQVWQWLVLIFLVFLWLAGGTTHPAPVVGLAVVFGALAVLALSVWRLLARPGAVPRLVKQGFLLMALVTLVIAAQLLPLPPELWTRLPGRATVVEAFAAAGLPLPWQPLSLSPPATRAALLALLPGFAMFAAGAGLSHRRWSAVARAIVALAVAATLLGLAQRFQGKTSVLYFYPDAASGLAQGTFSNRNFLAEQLFIAIPFLFALVFGELHKRRMPVVVAGAGFVGLFVVMVGLALSGSRAGIIFAMLALFLSLFLLVNRGADDTAPNVRRFIVIAVFFAALIVVQFGMIGLLRLAQTDVVSDYRTVIGAVSWSAMKTYFPWGSGYGTFIPVYALHETPATMVSSYVNAAHNDYLQLLLEGGAVTVVVLALFMVWVTVGAWHLWRQAGSDAQTLVGRAASLALVLFLLHALMDFGLRMPFLMGLFGLCLGLVAAGPKLHSRHHARASRSPAGAPAAAARPEIAPARPPRQGPFFKTAAPPPGPGAASEAPARRNPAEEGPA